MEGDRMKANFVQAVQPLVQPSVQAESRVFIGLCKVCKAFPRTYARVNQIPHTPAQAHSRAYTGARTPAHLAHASTGAPLRLAQTPAQHPAHLAQRKSHGF